MQLNWRQNFMLWLYIVGICVVLRGIFFYLHLHTQLTIPDADNNDFVFLVLPGSSFSLVADQLEDQGLLKQAEDLSIFARVTGKAGQIKAGEYVLEDGLNALDLLDKLVTGDVTYHQLVLVEGWTLVEALTAIQDNENIVSTLMVDEIIDEEGNNTIKNILQEKFEFTFYPEGMFFPDTYHFIKGTTDQEILQRARIRLEEVLEEEWQSRAVGLPYESSYEALIMASIIEKETARAEEREKIAGVFINRLQMGMRLQTDPTVIYGLGDEYNGNLTRSQLRLVTPYNTYRNSGLPPTPIALVGREAIIASMHPYQNENIYFVAKGDGSHYFSSTLEEHNRAVQQYQVQNRVENYTSQPE